MAFRRSAVLSVVALLSGLVAGTGAGATPLPGPTASPPGPAPAAGRSEQGPAALAQPRAALPGPLPVDPAGALGSAVTAAATHLGVAVHPEEAIRAARLA